MRVAIFGDVGGHATPFLNALIELGVDLNPLRIPDDLIVIQLGDLIHKGKDSDLLVEIADEFILNFPQQWIQLIGNHEFQHTPIGQQFWRCDCSIHTIATVQRWWLDGLANTAVGLKGGRAKQGKTNLVPQPETIITHAGLTFPFVRSLKQEMVVEDIVARLNQMQVESQTSVATAKHLRKSGIMLDAYPSPSAGPYWAAGANEGYFTWTDFEGASASIARFARSAFGTEEPLYTTHMPFNQVHGHTTAFDWDKGEWRPSVYKHFKISMRAYSDIRTTLYRPNEESGTLLGIDPGFEITHPTVGKQPCLLLENIENMWR